MITNGYKLVTALFPSVLPENISIIYTGLTGVYTYKGAAKGAAKGATSGATSWNYIEATNRNDIQTIFKNYNQNYK